MFWIPKKTTVIHDEVHKEFKEAWIRIMNWEYVENLSILLQKWDQSNVDDVNKWYFPTDIILSFVLDVENRINKCILEGNNDFAEIIKSEYTKINLTEGRDEIIKLVKNTLEE